jgi:hypothetical protein
VIRVHVAGNCRNFVGMRARRSDAAFLSSRVFSCAHRPAGALSQVGRLLDYSVTLTYTHRRVLETSVTVCAGNAN